MAAKRGLGAGIDSLIPKSREEEKRERAKQVIKEVIKETDKIDINKIEPNASQPRKNFNEDSLQELADSIKQHGLIEPLIVQEAEKGFFQIIAGERRWRAAKIAGLKEVPVIVKEYSDREVMEIALIENLQREDLNPIEEAEAFQRLIEEYELKQDEVAERVSKSRAAVTNSLRLLKLDERVRSMIIEDKIKSGHARALLAIENKDEQYEVALKVFDENLSVRETEKLVKKLQNPDIKKPEKKEDEQMKVVYASFEEKLKAAIGTKVNINHKDEDKGKIEIEYFSKDEFERIVEFLLHK